MPGIPRRLLADDETLVMALRPHWKDLVVPALVLLVVSPLATYAAAVLPEGDVQVWLRVLVVTAAVLVVLRWSVSPFLKWITTSYVITDHRLITRVGVISRAGRDMPLSRVNDVRFAHGGILERMMRSGTLVVESAGERGPLILRNVPRVEEVQRDVYRLAEADEQRRRHGQP